jgi:predicted ATPase with chaperone activity
VQNQSLRNERPKAADLQQALAGLKVGQEIFSQLGQAISSVGAIFLYGEPGNGKTSIAERLTNSFGSCIWIPRAINIAGEIVRIFDPMVHEEAPAAESGSSVERGIDRRWIRIRRPTVVAGGELTLEHLEFGLDRSTGSVEAPLHLKSNCGTLVIDDFGRQRVGATELLNRWIVPLEKRYDFLMTPSGKKIQVPFDQLIVFATNLEPRQLVDEAFLRRIPYKIEVSNPTEREFRDMFRSLSHEYGLQHRSEAIDHLIEKHYKASERKYRFCHVRDLLLQMDNYCRFHEYDFVMTTEVIDAVVLNYFGAMAPVPVTISGR